MTNRLSMLGFLILSLFLQPVWGDNIVFDLDLVLFHTNERASLGYMKLSNAINGLITFRERPVEFKIHIQKKFGEVLFWASLENAATCSANCAFDQSGNQYPPIMCSWLDGTLSSTEIRTLLLDGIATHPQWFEEKVEKKIITNMVNMVFTPENFISTRKLYRNAYKMLKQFKQAGHNIYILSNWDADSINLLKSKYRKLFALVDGVVVSGEENMLKPSPQIYEILLNRYNLDPEKTWFIDNQKDNVHVACSLKMQGVLCERVGYRKHPDTASIRKKIAAGREIQL